MAAAYNGSHRGAIVAIAALAAERACFRAVPGSRPLGRVACVQSGPGAERAHAAACEALAGGAAGLIAWGFSGALAPDLEAGTVLLPGRVRASDGRVLTSDVRWREAARAAIDPRLKVSSGDLLTAPEVLATPALKRRAAMQSGAVGVDMESAAILAAAHAAAVPCIVARVVIDTAADALPANAAAWIDARGNRRLAPTLTAMFSPLEWRGLLLLGQRFRAARRSLRMLAASLAACDFLFPYP